MVREITFSDISKILDDISYPIERATAAEELADVRLVLADGAAGLGDLISETSRGRFDSAADLESELHNVLPREAVGQPYQSDGDA